MSRIRKNYKVEAFGKIQLLECFPPSVGQISQEQKLQIDRVWQRALNTVGAKLVNETLLDFVSLEIGPSQVKIFANFIEYKYFYAQRKRIDLDLGIRPIGVSGIIFLEQDFDCFVVFAQRSEQVTEYPGLYELVPSGNIDKEYSYSNRVIDYRSKLLSEFVEETGLSRNYVRDISEFAFILDTNHNVFDVCCKITLEVKKETLFNGLLDSEEYKNPMFISTKDLGKFINENKKTIVPTSLAILEACGEVMLGKALWKDVGISVRI